MTKSLLLAAALFALTVPCWAEDWTTTDGHVYHNVQVISHDAAYVTIMHADGGGRIPLSSLTPTLQKRFDYDPAKAAAAIAAVKAADQRNQQALANEKAAAAASAAQGQNEVNAAVAQAALPPPPTDASAPVDSNSVAAVPPPPSGDPYPAYDDGSGSYIGYSYGPPVYSGYYGYGYGYGGAGRYGQSGYVRSGQSGYARSGPSGYAGNASPGAANGVTSGAISGPGVRTSPINSVLNAGGGAGGHSR